MADNPTRGNVELHEIWQQNQINFQGSAFSYQPKRAELREELKIDTTPEQLAKSVLQQVQVAAEKVS